MLQGTTDRSILSAVARRRERSEILSGLAAKQASESKESDVADSNEEAFFEEAHAISKTPEPMIENIDSNSGKNEESPAGEEVLEESFEEAIATEIDEGILGDLKKGRNDYGVLGELLPKIDVNSIPISQPKRVNAKTMSEGADTNASVECVRSVGKSKGRTSKRPASLLDSYFKGL